MSRTFACGQPQAHQRGLSPLRDPRLTTIKAEAAGASAVSHSSGGFGGHEFWQSLRSSQLESEVTCPDLNLHEDPIVGLSFCYRVAST